MKRQAALRLLRQRLADAYTDDEIFAAYFGMSEEAQSAIGRHKERIGNKTVRFGEEVCIRPIRP
jgi:hypothetical protein